MKKIKKYYKIILAVLIIIIFIVLSFLVFKSLFAESNNSDRLENIEKHKLTKNEISSTKEIFDEVENIKDIDIYTNNKIINIYIIFEKEIDFKEIKKVSNKVLDTFNEKNLKYYDIQIFLNCEEEECKEQQKIGYKHKSNSDFTWNR